MLFDLDGTLVEGRDAIWDAFSFALREHRAGPADRGGVEALIGQPLEEMFLRTLPGVDTPRVDALVATYRARFAERAADLVRETPGALAAVRAVAAEAAVAVVTTKARAPALLALEAAGFAEVFAVVIAREDAARMKPHPEPVLEAAKRLGVPPSACVMVGDTALDVGAARAAGARVVAVLCGHGDAAGLAAASPDATVPDLRSLSAALVDLWAKTT